MTVCLSVCDPSFLRHALNDLNSPYMRLHLLKTPSFSSVELGTKAVAHETFRI